jgi:hypothetical protein
MAKSEKAEGALCLVIVVGAGSKEGGGDSEEEEQEQEQEGGGNGGGKRKATGRGLVDKLVDSPWCRLGMSLAHSEHAYINGHQHVIPSLNGSNAAGSSGTRASLAFAACDTTLVVWQTTAAVVQWPATEAKERQIRLAFAAKIGRSKGKGKGKMQKGKKRGHAREGGDETVVKIRIGKRQKGDEAGRSGSNAEMAASKSESQQEQRRPSKMVLKAVANKERKKGERQGRHDELQALRKQRKEDKRAAKLAKRGAKEGRA